jgi:hypothetical protein
MSKYLLPLFWLRNRSLDAPARSDFPATAIFTNVVRFQPAHHLTRAALAPARHPVGGRRGLPLQPSPTRATHSGVERQAQGATVFRIVRSVLSC